MLAFPDTQINIFNFASFFCYPSSYWDEFEEPRSTNYIKLQFRHTKHKILLGILEHSKYHLIEVIFSSLKPNAISPLSIKHMQNVITNKIIFRMCCAVPIFLSYCFLNGVLLWWRYETETLGSDSILVGRTTKDKRHCLMSENQV